jgi:hypothetical protein
MSAVISVTSEIRIPSSLLVALFGHFENRFEGVGVGSNKIYVVIEPVIEHNDVYFQIVVRRMTGQVVCVATEEQIVVFELYWVENLVSHLQEFVYPVDRDIQLKVIDVSQEHLQ